MSQLGCAQQVNFMLSGNDLQLEDGDYHQRTALHLAASNGHIAMVRHLVLIHGANMNVLDRSDSNCILISIRALLLCMVAMLLCFIPRGIHG